MLFRTIRFEDSQGRRTTLQGAPPGFDARHAPRRALELTLTAENWSAGVTVRSGIDGRVVNQGAKLYCEFNNTHLEPLASEIVAEDGVYLAVRTSQSNIHMAQAARMRAFVDGEVCKKGAPGDSGTELHRTGADDRPSARPDAGAGEDRYFVYLEGSGHFRVQAGGTQSDGSCGSFRWRSWRSI